LITGAAGSIGAELARQIALFEPGRLVLLEKDETRLFALDLDLRREAPCVPLFPVVGDVRNRDRMRQVCDTFKPQVVFHAAAYKHVPLMQANPLEAIRNNAIATRTLARVAAKHGTARFVLISTDKAVNAQTVMGATKALCEWIVEGIAEDRSPMVAVAVRFGNVLASSGSVVPIFRRQIAAGGPVTVTDPAMARFFMTIPEAAQLVVQAGGAAKGGEIFVLDMGEPVRILDLARDMIRLSGLEPDRDIAIEIVGVRPGEKLDEDLFEAWETVQPTAHAKVRRATRPAIDAQWLDDRIDALEQLSTQGDTLAAEELLLQMVRAPRRAGSVTPVEPRVERARTL
jgi:FlaA1/EpsC-like NDP-sugar epimerase